MKLKTVEPKWLLILAFFGAGLFLGSLSIYIWVNAAPSQFRKIHLAGRNFKYINPLLAVDSPESSQFSPNHSVQVRIQSLIDDEKKKNNISSAAFYFRDLESGQWVGINPDAKFSPGKLLKVPLMIAYFKLAETNPPILNQQIYAEEVSSNSTDIVSGQYYSVNDLINRMILNYDDTATNMLFDRINKETLGEVFSDLGIDFKENKDTQDFISIKLYSLFFRVLYNSTYLNQEYSEKALELMDASGPNDVGLSANVPRAISTATRYGVKPLNGALEVYDCGIVYYPSHPYVLCGIAIGKDTKAVNDFMGSIGANVYSEVQHQYY